MGRKVIICSGALVVGVSAAYYVLSRGAADGTYVAADAGNGQRIEVARWGGQDGNNLLAAENSISTTPAGAASNISRKNQPSPRRAVEIAQQSGLPKDAIVAAKEIRKCSLIAGSTQKLLEMIAEKGTKTRRPLSEIVGPLEGRERMCQELDTSMIGQYEPMLKRAMEGGERGAAALWWRTPEAKALDNVDGQTEALDLLKRDATHCDRGSLAAYKLTALRFPKAFDSAEVAAVHAAFAQLVKDRKAKNDSFDELTKRFLPFYDVNRGVDKDVQAAKTAEILSWCSLNSELRSR